MKISRIAMCILLLMAIFAGAMSSVKGECSACKGGSPTAQQDVLNNEWAVFLGKENATTEVCPAPAALSIPGITGRTIRPCKQRKARHHPVKRIEYSILNSTNKEVDSLSVLVPLESANNSGIILDISPKSTEYIPGAISIPYTEFLRSGRQLSSLCPRWRRF